MTDLRSFFGDDHASHDLGDLLRTEVGDLAGVLRDAANGKAILVVAMVFDGPVIGPIASLGTQLTKEQAHDAEVALGAMLMHQSEEDGEAN